MPLNSSTSATGDTRWLTVRRDDAPRAAARYGGMRMHLIPDVGPVRDLNHWGTSVDGRRLMLWFSNGFGGVLVRGSLRGDQLRGRGRVWLDFLTWSARGPVRGVRVPRPVEPAPR